MEAPSKTFVPVPDEQHGQQAFGFVTALDQKRKEERAGEHLADVMVGAMADVFTTPVQKAGGQGWTDDLVRQRRGDIITERLIRLKRLADDIGEHLTEVESHEAKMEAYKEAVALVKERSKELTWWEALLMLSETSMAAPLNHEAYEEMKHCFARCYGPEQYRAVYSDEPLRANDCEMFRCSCYTSRKHPWPYLNKQWINEFNQQLSK